MVSWNEAVQIELNKPTMVHNRRWYIFEKDGKPTEDVDINKITKRLWDGDEFYGEPESPRAFNGRRVVGVRPLLQDKKLFGELVDRWKQSKSLRDRQLLREYLYPGTFQCVTNPFSISGFVEGFPGISPVLYHELSQEMLWIKFGYEEDWIEVSDDIVDVDGKSIVKEEEINLRRHK